MSAYMLGALRISATRSSSHGWPRWATIIRRSGKSSAMSSSHSAVDQRSLAREGNVVPWCQMIGMPWRCTAAKNGQCLRSVGSKCWYAGPSLRPRSPSTLTAWSNWSIASGSLGSIDAQPTILSGCWRA